MVWCSKPTPDQRGAEKGGGVQTAGHKGVGCRQWGMRGWGADSGAQGGAVRTGLRVVVVPQTLNPKP